MQIVIDIPEQLKKKIDNDFISSENFGNLIWYYALLIESIKDCVVLPNGHGRLIDAKEFEAYIRDGFLDLKGLFKTEKYRGLAEQLTESFLLDIHEQATIVPADKGGK